MQIRNSSENYGVIAKFFHWVVALLVISMLAFGYFLGDVSKEYQPFAYNLHKLIGLTILSLMLLRVVWTFINPRPELPMDLFNWQHAGVRVTHVLLYVATIAMPLSGWIGAVAAGRAPHIGDFKFELPIAPSEKVVDTAFMLHGNIAIALIALVSLHVLAALYHHFVRKDNILVRMLPWR